MVGVSAPVLEPEVESHPDGFSVRFGAVLYRLIPKPPFTGRLHVVLKASHGQHTSTDVVNLYSDMTRQETVRWRAYSPGMVDSGLRSRFDVLEREAILALDRLTLRDGFHARGESGLVLLLERLADARHAAFTVPGPSSVQPRESISDADLSLWEMALESARAHFNL